MLAEYDQFQGVRQDRDKSELDWSSFLLAENALITPEGAILAPPSYDRLWATLNLRTYLVALSLTAADRTAAILIENEGHCFVAFYDCVNFSMCGFFYLGKGAGAIEPPTLTASGATLTVLWRNLTAQRRWYCLRGANRILMGNGVDDNLIYISNPATLRRFGEGIRPPAPLVSAGDVTESAPIDASLVVGDVTFVALEPNWNRQEAGGDGGYRRDRGNAVKVAVAQSVYNYFTSTLNGSGDYANPYVYTVLIPSDLATAAEFTTFVNADPNAQGIVTARVSGSESGLVSPFSATYLAGAVTQFSETDIFKGPQLAVVATYVRNIATGFVQETQPSAAAVTQVFENGRLQVTLQENDHPYAAEYQSVRLYVADIAAENFTLSPEFYESFKFALEVPNTPGTHTIAPSMLQSKPVPTDNRMMPGCRFFAFSNNRIYAAGNYDFPLRIWETKSPSQQDQMPEGIGTFGYRDLQGYVADDEIVAVADFRGRPIVYLKSGHAWILNGTSNNPMTLLAGAASHGAVLNWVGGEQFYLGRDRNVYQIAYTPNDSNPSPTPNTALAFPQIGRYLQQQTDAGDFGFVHSFADFANKRWWLWARGPQGNVKCFVLNLNTKVVTGPLDFPQFLAVDAISEQDQRMIGADANGNLFVMTLAEPETDFTANTSGLSTLPISTPVTSALDGVGLVVLPGSLFVPKASVLRIRTAPHHLGSMGKRKTLKRIRFTIVRGSAGIVQIILTNDRGQKITRSLGEIVAKTDHLVNCLISGTLLQVEILAVVGDDKPFVIRNLRAEFETNAAA
jgi:hypothetical protein